MEEKKVKSHRQRFSRHRFNQIMISNLLKKQLELLKPSVAKKINAVWNPSFADVIFHLIDYYNSHPEPVALPALVVSGRKTVLSHRSIIMPRKGVIGKW